MGNLTSNVFNSVNVMRKIGKLGNNLYLVQILSKTFAFLLFKLLIDKIKKLQKYIKTLMLKYSMEEQ